MSGLRLRRPRVAPHLKRLRQAVRWTVQGTVTPHLALEQRLAGKVVLVTGASSGIGAGTARRLAAAGARVVIAARSFDKLQTLAHDIEAAGGLAYPVACDISDLDDCDRLCRQVLEQFGRVDILVNNAGRSIRRSILQSGDRFHDYQRTMQLNYFGAIRIAMNLIPRMVELGDGHIINISTLGVQTGVPRFSAYLGSKCALEGWTQAAQNELAHQGVDFTLVNYPLVRTPMIAPTKVYDYFPALTESEAVRWLCDAIVRRPKRIVPAFGLLSVAMNYTLPRTAEFIVNVGYQLVPETLSKVASLDEERAARKRASVTSIRGS